MNLLPTRTLTCIFVLLIISLPAFGQATKEEKEKKELQKKAIAILDGVIAESGASSTIIEQLYIQIKAAKLLWKHDETRARSIINNAKGLFASIPLPEVQPDSYDKTAMIKMSMDIESYRKLRADLVKFVVDADVTLALDILQSTKLQKPEPKQDGENPSRGQFNRAYDDKTLEVELAARAAKTNPKFAYETAVDLLNAEGDAHQMPGRISDIWRQLRISDMQMAERLAGDVLQSIKAESEGAPYQMRAGTAMLQIWAKAMKSESNSDKSKDKQPALSSTEEKLFREYLEIYVTSVSNIKVEDNEHSDSILLDSLGTLMPHIQKSHPSRVAALKKISGNRSDESEVNTSSESTGEAENKSVQDMVKEAETAHGSDKDFLLMEAVKKAIDTGDIATAENIRDKHITNLELKSYVNNMVEEGKAKAGTSSESDNVDDTLKALSTIKDDNVKVDTLSHIASKHFKNNKKDAARKFIDAATGITGGRSRTHKQLLAQISIATSLVDMDIDRSLELSATVVDRLDYLLSNVKELLEFSGVIDFSPSFLGIIAMETENSPYLMPLVNLFVAQSGKDIDKTFGTINRAQNRDAATMIGLFVLTGVLN